MPPPRPLLITVAGRQYFIRNRARGKFLPADRNHREVCIYRGIYTEKENGVGLQLWGAHAPSRVGVGALADASFCFIETTDITGWHG